MGHRDTDRNLPSGVDESIFDGEDAFLLEPLARGWATLDPERGSVIMARAWARRQVSSGPESISQLRYVQMVHFSGCYVEEGNIYIFVYSGFLGFEMMLAFI